MIASLLVAGLVVLGIMAVVGAAVAIAKLTASGNDADRNFSCNKVGSPVQGCPLTQPKLVDNGADAITKSARYKDCPDDVKKEITSKAFTDSEKKDLQEVLDKYKPLMKCDNNPVKEIGRSNKGITKKNSGCVSETDTMGEWFDDSGTLVLTDAASNPVDFADKDTQFKGTATHELAHGLLNRFDPRDCKAYDTPDDNPLMKEFRKSAGWDSTGTTLAETAGNKAPTDYAKTNSQEDLSESMMLYMYDPEKLKKASPERYEFCKKLMGDK